MRPRIGYATVVEDWDALMADLGLEGREVLEQRVNWAERTVRFLSHPVVAPFLLSLGFLGLLVEIKTPGFGRGGRGRGSLPRPLLRVSHDHRARRGRRGDPLRGRRPAALVEVFLVPGIGVFAILGGVAMLAGVYMSLLGSIPIAADFARASSVLAAALS
jgi:membrane-bound serine protease (ClpP class)